MEELNDNLVRVTIFGQEYTIKSKADRAYVINVANYVNSKMEEVESALPVVQSPLKIAILAAMNITDELFNCQRERDEIVRTVEERAEFLIEEIDEQLK